MKKFMATLAIVLFTVALTSYNNTNDQIPGDTNSTQTQEPGAGTDPILPTKSTDL